MKMKTAVSLPDELFRAAEKTAEQLGIPRSQLFAKALEEFISNHRKEHITERLDQVYDKIVNKAGGPNQNAGLESLRELTKHDTW